VCPIGLIGPVGAHLGPELLFQAALGVLEALRAAARHRLRLRRPLGLQALLGLAQPPAAPLRGRELRRQLVAARLPVALILGRIDRLGLLDDLARELLIIEVSLRDAFACSFVPSTAMTPTLASPLRAQSVSTSPNRLAIASWWRSRNRASVA
jgi:hypothetical protein